jgi:hypothetical protein
LFPKHTFLQLAEAVETGNGSVEIQEQQTQQQQNSEVQYVSVLFLSKKKIFSSIGKFIRQHWQIYLPALANIFTSIGKYIYQHWQIYLPALANIFTSIVQIRENF